MLEEQEQDNLNEFNRLDKLEHILNTFGIMQPIEEKQSNKFPSYLIVETLQDLKVNEICEINPNGLYIDEYENCWLEPYTEIFRDIQEHENQLLDCLRVKKNENGYHVSFLSTIQYKWRKLSQPIVEYREFRIITEEADLLPVTSINLIHVETIN